MGSMNKVFHCLFESVQYDRGTYILNQLLGNCYDMSLRVDGFLMISTINHYKEKCTLLRNLVNILQRRLEQRRLPFAHGFIYNVLLGFLWCDPTRPSLISFHYIDLSNYFLIKSEPSCKHVIYHYCCVPAVRMTTGVDRVLTQNGLEHQSTH